MLQRKACGSSSSKTSVDSPVSIIKNWRDANGFLCHSLCPGGVHERRGYATPGAPEGPACHTRHRPRRSGLLRSLIVSAAVPAASCQPAGVLDPQGPIASAQRLLLINSTEIMLVVVIPVILATLAFAWWYRSSNPRASRASDESFEGRIEFVTWSIPALT